MLFGYEKKFFFITITVVKGIANVDSDFQTITRAVKVGHKPVSRFQLFLFGSRVSESWASLLLLGSAAE